jgi:hypothetical protein
MNNVVEIWTDSTSGHLFWCNRIVAILLWHYAVRAHSTRRVRADDHGHDGDGIVQCCRVHIPGTGVQSGVGIGSRVCRAKRR